MKKTPFQLHKEREEVKRKREQEAAALVFDDFVESFKPDDDTGHSGFQNFVRGGQILPGQKEEGDAYDPILSNRNTDAAWT